MGLKFLLFCQAHFAHCAMPRSTIVVAVLTLMLLRPATAVRKFGFFAKFIPGPGEAGFTGPGGRRQFDPDYVPTNPPSPRYYTTSRPGSPVRSRRQFDPYTTTTTTAAPPTTLPPRSVFQRDLTSWLIGITRRRADDSLRIESLGSC